MTPSVQRGEPRHGRSSDRARSRAAPSRPGAAEAARATGRPVGRFVAPVVSRLVASLLLLTALVVAGMTVATLPLTGASHDLPEIVEAHRSLTAGILELDALTGDYARPGGGSAAAERDRVAAELAPIFETLSEHAALVDDDATARAIGAELAAARDWLDRYVAPAFAVQPGPQGYRPRLAARGGALFHTFLRSGVDVDAALHEAMAAPQGRTLLLLRITTVVALVGAAAAWLMIGRARQRLLAQLSEPLLALETVVQRMLNNDPGARADAAHGPKEVRAIARALNDFADAHLRTRALEGRIQTQLHVLDGAKDDFVSNVSHELRTPLTTINGYLEIVAEEFDGRMSPRHVRMVEAARRNVDRLGGLIDDLLALSRAEDRPTEMECSDVAELVNDAVTDVRIPAARRGIAIEVADPAEPFPVVGDRASLHRAFANVLSNAVKFSHDDGVVEVELKRVGNRVQVAVRDHGIGIPAADLDRLGTRFFRASNAMSNEIAGTGLGLRIVQTIVGKHAGEVDLESEEGRGTTVFVRLRLGETQVGRAPARAGDASPASPALPPISSPGGLARVVRSP